MSEADEFADLVERVHQIEDAVESRGFALLLDRLTADMAKLQLEILGGRLERDDYLRKSGEYGGMRRILELPVQVRRELDTERERLQEELEALEEQFEDAAA